MAGHPVLRATVEALQQFRFQITSEAELQEAVAAALTVDGFRFEREVVLGLGDRIDFVVDVDGCQADPVAAYFLISEEGSDPIMAEVLGLKRKQSEGIRDPQREVIERLQSTEGHIKRLAEEVLRKVGEQ